jgi:hypothetical protein
MTMKLVMLKYATSCPKQLKRLWRVAKAIVAGCERKWAFGPPETHQIAARATLRRKEGLVLLHIRPQLTLDAYYWMKLAMLTEWDNWREHNCMQLLLRCKCVLVPDSGPNGGFVIRNGAPTRADGLMEEARPCRAIKEE